MDALPHADEGFADETPLRGELLSRAKEEMIVMHPLPRVNGEPTPTSMPVFCSDAFAEIDPDVDFDSRRAVYFRQMRYGLFVSILLLSLVVVCLMYFVTQIRMALLASVMG